MRVGVNLGSGQRPFASTMEVTWINVDAQAKWAPDLVWERGKLPMPDESADYFVLHHTYEHFGCGEGKFLLAEAFRVLKAYGSLLVFVPDMRALAQRWLAGGITTQIYITNVYGAFMGNDADRHKWGFDPASLGEEINNVDGNVHWGLIKPFDWRTIPGASIAKDWWILGMEAVK